MEREHVLFVAYQKMRNEVNALSKRSIIIFSCLIILASCSSIKSSFSPEQVISNALNESENVSQSYNAKAVMITYENGEIVDETHVKEWIAKDGRIRIESETSNDEKIIAVNNGVEVLTYIVNEKEVLVTDEQELLELNAPSLKEQAMHLLEIIYETHDVEVKGEDEIAGRKTFHIKARPKESSLYGEQEFWIDKQNWMILKSVATFGDSRLETVYKEIDFSDQFGDDIFQIDLPDDVKRINVGDLSNTKEVSLTEATEALGELFLYFPANNNVEIDKIELDQYNQSEFERVEISLEYTKDGLPLFSLGIFKSPDVANHLGEGEEAHTFRGKEGIYFSSSGFRSLSWDEDGLRYSIIFHDPDFTLEQLVEMAEDMDLVE